MYKFDADKVSAGTPSSVSNGNNRASFAESLNKMVSNYAKFNQKTVVNEDINQTRNLQTSTKNNGFDKVMDTTDKKNEENTDEFIADNSTMQTTKPQRILLTDTIPVNYDNRLEGLQNNNIDTTEINFLDQNEILDSSFNRNEISGREAGFVELKPRPNYDHIIISDFIDLNKLSRKTLRNSIDEENSSEGGKSFTEDQSIPKEHIKVVNVSEVHNNSNGHYETIYLEVTKQNSRNRGTKLKGSVISNTSLSDDSLQNLMEMPGKNNPLNNIVSHVEDDYTRLDSIGDQIAAINRRGNIDEDDGLEDTKDTKSGPTNSIELNGNETNQEGSGSFPIEQIKAGLVNFEKKEVEQNIEESKKIDYQTEPRWSQATKNLYKQLNQGYQSSGASYQVPTTSGVNNGNTLTGSTEYTPFVQKYPGWPNEKDHQYSDMDPATGMLD